jgi:hypothetical protein
MWKIIIFGIALLVSSFAHAQFNGCKAGFCNFYYGAGGGTTFLLSNTGSALLVNTGSKFLVN